MPKSQKLLDQSAYMAIDERREEESGLVMHALRFKGRDIHMCSVSKKKEGGWLD